MPRSEPGPLPLRGIFAAVESGDLEKVKTSPKENPGLVFRKNPGLEPTPLFYAAEADHEGVVKLLLSHRANVNAKDMFDQTPLQAAGVNGHQDVAKLLRQHGGHE